MEKVNKALDFLSKNTAKVLVATLTILAVPIAIYFIFDLEVFWLINTAFCIGVLALLWVLVTAVLLVVCRIYENKEDRELERVDYSKSYPRTLTDTTIGKITFSGSYWSRDDSVPFLFRGCTFKLKVEGPSADEAEIFEGQKAGFKRFLQIKEESGDLVMEAVKEWCKTHSFLPNSFLPSRLLISPCGETAIVGLISSRKVCDLVNTSDEEPTGLAVVVKKNVFPLVYDRDEYEDRVYEEVWSV